MSLFSRLRRKAVLPDDDFSPMRGFTVQYGESTTFTAPEDVFVRMVAGSAEKTAQYQYFILEMLADEGHAEAIHGGFQMQAEAISRLEFEDAQLLGLPPVFTGVIQTKVSGWTASSNFEIDVALRLSGSHPEAPKRRGPAIKVAGETFRASVPLLRALRALEEHRATPAERRQEIENIKLVARIQEAQRIAEESNDPAERDANFDINLGALDSFITRTPEKIGLMVDEGPNGSLKISPDIGAAVSPDLLESRWHQLDTAARTHPTDCPPTRVAPQEAVLRVENTLTYLQPQQMEAIAEIRERPVIPADEVQQFLESPGSYYDPDLVDLDLKLGVHVKGLGVVTPVSFQDAIDNGIDWFWKLDAVAPPEELSSMAKNLQEHESLEQAIEDVWELGEKTISTHGMLVDVSDETRVNQALWMSKERIAEAGSVAQDEAAREDKKITVGMHVTHDEGSATSMQARAEAARPLRPVNSGSLRRTPLPHQIEGIEWLAGLMQNAFAGQAAEDSALKGGLLADDMGLGKTYTILASMRELLAYQESVEAQLLPTLAVLPVALIENWRNEIKETFGAEHGPFSDVVVLHGAELRRYKKRGAGVETLVSAEDLDTSGMVREDRLHAALRVGEKEGAARLDRPGVLVLTSYDVLRRYQVSLGLVDWGTVIFDEAQNIKNPDALVSRAAKALKARFKLLVTGTPVENSLLDFWSLIDTAQPGLLGDWPTFRTKWVLPLEAASPDEHQRLGAELREAVGAFMLRRVKEDQLQGLPQKNVHEYRSFMPVVQQECYDQIIADHRSGSKAKGGALATLQKLRAASLHPALITGDLDKGVKLVDDSARTKLLIREILDQIKMADEKAIVFAITKKMQREVALWINEIYGLRISIVNGDTKATGKGDTRISRIRDFEKREGFNVIIMSPEAAGVGLTVTGANHAIHLERAWNPAKEAQATDRVHRIGQTRNVYVHIPIALHPESTSFDVNLAALLSDKVALKDAVVVPNAVTESQMESALGL